MGRKPETTLGSGAGCLDLVALPVTIARTLWAMLVHAQQLKATWYEVSALDYRTTDQRR